MRKKALLAMDLDGTIINNADEVPEAIRKTILNLKDMGFYFTVATGRGMSSVKHYELPLNCPGVFENGGKICFPNGHILQIFPFSKRERQDIIALLKREKGRVEYAFFPSLEGQHYIFFIPNKDHTEAIAAGFTASFGHATEDEGEFFDAFENGAARLAIVGNLTARIHGLNHSTNHDSAGVHYHEFNHRGANKGAGVCLIAKHIGVDKNRVIIAGNDENDISMFRQNFGVRIAVGPTCPKSLRCRATHYAASMDELPLILRGLAAELRR